MLNTCGSFPLTGYEVSWCTKAGHGARLIPKDTLKGVHVVKTSKYIQWTGKGDLTKVRSSQSSGQLKE